MLIRPAEESFRRGIVALEHGRRVEALALLEAAVVIERREGVERPQARYLSYYGLCLGLETGRIAEGIRCCREALAREFYNADLFCNLGRLLLIAGERAEAHAIFKRGLRLQPGHPGIQQELRRMGIRRRPALFFLARANPLNVVLGRLLSADEVRNGRPPAPKRR